MTAGYMLVKRESSRYIFSRKLCGKKSVGSSVSFWLNFSVNHFVKILFKILCNFSGLVFFAEESLSADN